MDKTLKEEKHPWAIYVYVCLPVTINIRICKLEYNNVDGRFHAGNGMQWAVDENSLSQPICILKNNPYKFTIISTSLEAGVNEMYLNNIELKRHLTSSTLEVKNLVGRLNNDQIYIDSILWNEYDLNISSILNYFGVGRTTIDGRVKYVLFASKTIKKYLKYGFKEFIEVVNSNIEDCVRKALEIEKNLESGEMDYSIMERLDVFNNVVAHHTVDGRNIPVVKYIGNGIKPEFELMRCD